MRANGRCMSRSPETFSFGVDESCTDDTKKGDGV
jgi:hypothetical protein